MPPAFRTRGTQDQASRTARHRCSGAYSLASSMACARSRTMTMPPLAARLCRDDLARGSARPSGSPPAPPPPRPAAATGVSRMALASGSCSAWASRSAATRAGSARIVGHDHRLGGAGDLVDGHRAGHGALGQGHEDVAGAQDLVHPGHASRCRRPGRRWPGRRPCGRPGARRRRGRRPGSPAGTRRRGPAAWPRRSRRRRPPGPGWPCAAARTGRRPCRPARRGPPAPGAGPSGPGRRPRSQCSHDGCCSRWWKARSCSAAVCRAWRRPSGKESQAACRSAAGTSGDSTRAPSMRSVYERSAASPPVRTSSRMRGHGLGRRGPGAEHGVQARLDVGRRHGLFHGPAGQNGPPGGGQVVDDAYYHCLVRGTGPRLTPGTVCSSVVTPFRGVAGSRRRI